MEGFSGALSQNWKNSGSFRWWTILAIAGLMINLALTVLWQMEVFAFEDSPPTNDLKIYREAGGRFLQRENLYIVPRADFGLYAYSPAFAAVLGLLTLLPYKLVWIMDALLHIMIYWTIYVRWFRIFREQGLNPAAEALVRLFPLWIIFTGLLYEIAYMNIYIFMAFIATLLIEAMLKQQAGRAVLWLAVLLPIKPQWAFALGIPFLLGQWRFMVKVVFGAALAYSATIAIMVVFTGQYALEQYQAYFQFLGSIPHTFVWNTLVDNGHIGYNNSILQLVIFLTNHAPFSILLSNVIKILLSVPLVVIYWRYRHDLLKKPTPALTLEWASALYLLAFLWLDVATELTFGIVIFTYLLGTLHKPELKNVARIIFLPYALTHIWITITGILSFLIPLPDIIIDPSLFIPFILIATLGLYALVLGQLNTRIRQPVYPQIKGKNVLQVILWT